MFSGLFEDGDQVVGAKNLVFLAVDLDFAAAVFGDEHAVTHLDFEGNFLAVLVSFAGAEHADDAFLGLFFGSIGDDDAALFNFFFFGWLDQDAVAQRFDVECHIMFYCVMLCVSSNYLPIRTRGGKSVWVVLTQRRKDAELRRSGIFVAGVTR